MATSTGKTRRAIAEGYIPAWSHGPEPQMLSRETACLLDAGDRDAHVRITVYFADREPLGPSRVTVPARRTRTTRARPKSDVPIVVQHRRLDSRQAELALLSTIAFAGD